MIKRICLIVCLILSIESLYASSMDHAAFDIGNSGIEIRWGMDIDDFDDLENLYDILSLVAANYDRLYSQKKYISITYYKDSDKYMLRYSIDNKEHIDIYSKKFSETLKIIKGILIENFQLKDDIPESTPLLLLAMPASDDYKDPGYNKLSEFYIGPAPGTMQAVENKKLYYLYFFFKEKNIFKLIQQEPSFRVVLIKKDINRNNIGKMDSIK